MPSLLPTLALALLAAALAGAAYVRLAPMEASRWHTAPDVAALSGRPNAWRLGEGGDAPAIASTLPPAEALARLDAVATAEPGVTRLAGAPEAGLVTWVQRSRLMGYPDAVSATAVAEGTGSVVSIWSRSRFGHSDLGVNRARMERWVGKAGLGRRTGD